MNDFYNFGIKSNCDKVRTHGYHRFFPQHIEKFRLMEGAMVEIGIQEGRSLTIWENYFKKFKIYGIDIESEYMGDRVVIFKADQSKLHDLQSVLSKVVENVYFINDDGSHVPSHQLLTFNLYFEKLLQPGGIYIIEDVEVSYWRTGSIYAYPTLYGYKHPESVLEVFKHVVDDINSFYMNDADKKKQDDLLSRYLSKETRSMIRSVQFAQNCILIEKKNEEDYRYAKGQYHWKDHL